MTKENTQTRPPIVVVMGHVDHGKSSLLEAVREDFAITAKESGGITQHIGAYEAEHNGKRITFLDTPGHEAFGAIRSRGAKVADIAVLVVAADDGVKEQTKEAVARAKEAGLPIIVALNKVDRPQANAHRVSGELAQEGILLEGRGGQVPVVETSATERKGISELLDMIELVAEVEGLKASSEGPASGVVLESSMDAKRGPAATLLVRGGELKAGDAVGTPSAAGKVRILENARGESVETARPSSPVNVIGFEKAPLAGEEFSVYEDVKEAAENVTARSEPAPPPSLGAEAGVTVVLKADVLGSLEAVKDTLAQIPQEKVGLKIVGSGVGDVTEGDVKLASSAEAFILGFRVKALGGVVALAERSGVKILLFDVIYELVERARTLLESELSEESVTKDLGALRVLAVFRTQKDSQIVGGEVVRGEARKGANVTVLRGEEVVGVARAASVKRGQTEADSVGKGEEAGVLLEGISEVREGDVLEFSVKETRRVEL